MQDEIFYVVESCYVLCMYVKVHTVTSCCKFQFSIRQINKMIFQHASDHCRTHSDNNMA